MDEELRGAGRFDSLVVRLVAPNEVPRFNELLDQHHFLGHRLTGRVLRYVALEDDEWVALVGFGSAALSVGSRERFIGWSEQEKRRRLRFVANNQRFCVLPGRSVGGHAICTRFGSAPCAWLGTLSMFVSWRARTRPAR